MHTELCFWFITLFVKNLVAASMKVFVAIFLRISFSLVSIRISKRKSITTKKYLLYQ